MRLVPRTIGVPALAATTALWQTLAEALTFRPTPTFARPPCGLQNTDQAPKPTSPPDDTHSVLRAQRVPRVGGQSDICGWVAGNIADPVSCQQGFYCATASMYVGCCAQVSCVGIVTTCYDILGPICDARCQLNYSNLICSQTNAPYCAEYFYPGGSVGFGCAQISGYTASVLLSTVSQFGSLNPVITSSSSTVISTPASTSTSSTPAPAPVPSGGSSLTGGQIAGIAIGAALGVLILCAAIFFAVRQNRRRARAARANANMYAPPPPGPIQPNRALTASPIESYQMNGYSSGVPSGMFPIPIKDEVGHESYHSPSPVSQQAAYAGQPWQYGPVDGAGGEQLGSGEQLGARPTSYPLPYDGFNGPPIPEMVGSHMEPPR